MGKVAVVDHAGKRITLSLIKFGPLKRLLWRFGKRFGMIKSYEWAIFTPRYEIGVFDGSPCSLLTCPIIYFIIQMLILPTENGQSWLLWLSKMGLGEINSISLSGMASRVSRDSMELGLREH
jgi:hypothetical protein